MNLGAHHFTEDPIRAAALKLDATSARMLNRGLFKNLLHCAVRLEQDLAIERKNNEKLMAQLLLLQKEKEND